MKKLKLNGRQRYLIIRNITICWIISMCVSGIYVIFFTMLELPENSVYEDFGWLLVNIMICLNIIDLILLPLIGDGMEMPTKPPIIFKYLFEDYSECKLRLEKTFNELEYTNKKIYNTNKSNKIIFYTKRDNFFRRKGYLFSQNTYAILKMEDISVNNLNNILDIYYRYLEETKLIENGGYYYFTLIVCSEKRNYLLKKMSLKHLYLGVDEEVILVNINLSNEKIYLPDVDSLLTKKFKEIFNVIKKN